MMKITRILLVISGLVFMQGEPLYADDSQPGEMVSAEETLASWKQRELERTRKLVQIIKRVKNNASCDLAIEAVRKLYMDAQQEAYLDPCPEKDFEYDQLGSREKKQFDKVVKQLKKELLRLYKAHGSLHMDDGLANTRSPSKPGRRTKSRKSSNLHPGKLDELSDLILEFALVRDVLFPISLE